MWQRHQVDRGSITCGRVWTTQIYRKPGSALKLKIRGPGNRTLGTLEVGSGGVFWKGKHRRRRQQITWSEFATRMEQPLK